METSFQLNVANVMNWFSSAKWKGGNMERCLISGASGFIGSNLSQRLIREGAKVYHLPHEMLKTPRILEEFICSIQPDYIFHLAAYGNKYDQTDEDQMIQSNITGTYNLLVAAHDVPYKAFINTGSSSEYGTKLAPMKETDSLDTDTFYGVTKASATLLCRAYAQKYHKPIVTVRPFSVYGIGDDPDKFIGKAIRCLKHNQILSLSKGMHDWIYIDEFLSGLMTVAKNASILIGQAVNIGTGKQYSNHAVIAYLRQISGKPLRVRLVDKLRAYDTSQSWVADISLLKSLGFEPKISLEEGLERTYYGYRE